MTITFTINNITCDLVNTVMIRKFFQMVFVGNNRKELNIYTATVLGGMEEKSIDSELFISSLSDLTEFCMKFGFVVTGNDDNDVMEIINSDVTDGERNFLSQVDCIQQVWGKQCEILYNNQKNLQEKYNEFRKLNPESQNKNLSSLNSQGEGEDSNNMENLRILASMAQNKVLWIKDDSKKPEKEMCSIAIPGIFSPEDYKCPERIVKSSKWKNHQNDGNENAFYRISVPKEQKICKGIELLNWVKTTIRFKYRLNDQNLNFCIKKEGDDTYYIAPDFTWYFSPPVKSFISYESSSAEAKWQRNSKNDKECGVHELCKCPVKPEIDTLFTSKRYDNVINPVANKTTVNFQRWTEDEMIGYRQKYRISAKNVFIRASDFNDIKELNIFIDTTDEHSRGNRQYVLGIMISFALAFGIDGARLEAAQKYFPLEKLFLADTWWLFMIVSLTLNLLIRPVRSMQKRKYIHWRKWNIIFSLIRIFVVFCVDHSIILTEWFQNSVGTYFMTLLQNTFMFKINVFNIFQLIFCVLLLSNMFYIIRNVKKYHDPVLSSLFEEDIL